MPRWFRRGGTRKDRASPSSLFRVAKQFLRLQANGPRLFPITNDAPDFTNRSAPAHSSHSCISRFQLHLALFWISRLCFSCVSAPSLTRSRVPGPRRNNVAPPRFSPVGARHVVPGDRARLLALSHPPNVVILSATPLPAMTRCLFAATSATAIQNVPVALC
jgi:hypothetical protein